MGSAYSRILDFVSLDLSEAVDPFKERIKLETNFETPDSKYIKLNDPRSASNNIDRTPILVQASNKTPVRPKYLETDLDDEPILEESDTQVKSESKRLLECEAPQLMDTPVAAKAPSLRKQLLMGKGLTCVVNNKEPLNKLGRKPLGLVSSNSPLTTPPNLKWKTIEGERLQRGIIPSGDSENELPSPISSFPPEVVQSAPGRLRMKKTKWSKDTIVV